MSSDGPAEPPFGPYEFTEELAERLADLPGIERIARRELGLQVVWQGRKLEVELDSFYAAYCRQPDQLAAIASMLVQAIQSQGVTRGATSWAEVSDRIYPMLKPLGILAEVRERDLPMLVYRPFLADLLIAFVIDEDRSVIYVSEEHLKAWQIKESDLYAQALENLRKRSGLPDQLTLMGEGERLLLIYNTGDGYDAARLLLTDLLSEWQEHTAGRLVLGIPNRDFLIGFSDASPAILRQVAQQIAIDSTHRDYGLTDQLFTLVAGRLELYQFSRSGE